MWRTTDNSLALKVPEQVYFLSCLHQPGLSGREAVRPNLQVRSHKMGFSDQKTKSAACFGTNVHCQGPMEGGNGNSQIPLMFRSGRSEHFPSMVKVKDATKWNTNQHLKRPAAKRWYFFAIFNLSSVTRFTLALLRQLSLLSLKKNIFLLLLLLCALPAQSQSYTLECRHFTSKEGLSHNAVANIYEDGRGQFWITTRFGVNRFDGENFRVYTRENHGIHSNTISHVLEDPDGMMWFLTGLDGLRQVAFYQDFGYSLFDPYREESLLAEDYLPADMLADLDRCSVYAQLPDKSIIFVSNEGFFLHYRGKGNFQRVAIDMPPHRIIRISTESDSAFFLTQIADSNARLELSNIYLLNGEKLISSAAPATPENLTLGAPFSFPTGKHWASVLTDKSEGAEQGYYFLHDGDWPHAILNIRDSFPFLPENASLQFLDEVRNEYWVKSGDTTLLLNTAKGIIAEFPDLKLGPFIRRDSRGNFLSSDGQNGFSLITVHPQHFHSLGLPGYSHRGLTIDNKERYWMSIDKSSYGSGIPKDNDSIIVTHNHTVIKDSKGNIWSGMPSNLPAFPGLSKAFLRQFKNGDPQDVEIYSAEEEIDPAIWVIWEHPETGFIWSASVGGEVLVIDPVSGDVTMLISKTSGLLPDVTFIYAFALGPEGSIWMSTSQGLYQLNDGGEIIGRYYLNGSPPFKLPANDIHHCYIDRDGVFWLATGDAGLLRWLPDNSQPPRQYTTLDGLPSMILHATYEDAVGYLWISSENGIIQFHKKTELFTVYRTEEGTTDTEFNRISHYRHPDGTLYFGGVSGITAFNPLDFHQVEELPKDDNYIIPLVIQQINPKTGERENRIAEIQQENLITIYPENPRATLELLSPELNPRPFLITSQIIGWQADPVRMKEAHISLEGLPYGQHKLVLQAFDLTGRVLQEETIDILVIRPFYLSWWFIIMAVSSLLAIGLLISGLETRRLRKLVKERTKIIEEDKQLIEQQAVELRKNDELKTRFFTNISHELRTPLTLIMGPIRRILQSNDLPSESFNNLHRAYTNSERLQDMVNDILDLSKLEEGKLQANSESTQVHPFLCRVVSYFDSLALQRGVDLVSELAVTSDLHLAVDQQKLETILRNLITNAIKFTPPGGRVTAMAAWKNNSLIIKISDTGYGINQKDLPKLFERFYQARYGSTTNEIQGGTGIGLAICHELTQLMKGQITVESQLGAGSTFTVLLPAEKVAPPHAQLPLIDPFSEDDTAFVARPQVQGEVTGARPGLPRLLIVEDNADLRDYLHEILCDNFQLKFAYHGGLALDYLRTCTELPDLIITDLMMPQMDGFHLLRHLKADQSYSLIPTIVLSARAAIGDRMNTLRTGIDDYILKPFHEQELIQRIHNLLANAQAREAAKQERSIPEPLSESAFGTNHEKNQPDQDEEDAFLQDLKKSIHKNLGNPDFGNKELAALFYISPRTLSRRIKSATGMSTNKFMLEIRLLVAREMLEASPRPTLSTVAESIGFKKTSYLSTRFRERFGVLPSEYAG